MAETARPLVSVVVPAYNADRHIGEAVSSVAAQTLTDWELVVVDDGSTDETADLVDRFGDPRVRCLRTAHTGLPAAARNAGIEASAGRYVAFLDADDFWRPPKLERQVAVLEQRADVGLVYCAAEALAGGEVVPVDAPPSPEPAVQFERLAEWNFIHNSSVVVRRTLLERYGLLDTDPRLKGTEDYELWLRLAPLVRFHRVDEPLLVYRVHGAGVSADAERMATASVVALQKAAARDPERFERLGPMFFRSLGQRRCLAGLPGSGRQELARALRRSPRDLTAWKWFLLSLLGSRIVRPLFRAKAGILARISGSFRRSPQPSQ